MTRCIWCQDEFPPHPRGLPKIFCSSKCRGGYHIALRRWGQAAFENGLVSTETLKSVGRKACTDTEEGEDG